MAEPQLGTDQAITTPPVTGDKDLDAWLLMVHHHLYSLQTGGTGTLDNSNITTSTLTGIKHDNLAGITSYQHHGANLHKDLDQATASTDATSSSVSVTSADASTGLASSVIVTTANADITYDANEVSLINELKSDLNQLVADVNAVAAAYNTCKNLSNEIKIDVNQLKSDLNAAVTNINDLKTKLRTAKVLAA